MIKFISKSCIGYLLLFFQSENDSSIILTFCNFFLPLLGDLALIFGLGRVFSNIESCKGCFFGDSVLFFFLLGDLDFLEGDKLSSFDGDFESLIGLKASKSSSEGDLSSIFLNSSLLRFLIAGF